MVKQYRISHHHLAGNVDGLRRTELPFDVPANEFMTIEGKKISTSRNWLSGCLII